MARVLIVDTTTWDSGADTQAQPLGWRCAAEVARCPSSAVSDELWRSCRVHSRDDGGASEPPPTHGSSSPWRVRWHLFPLPLPAVNKYFRVDVEAVVGVMDAQTRAWMGQPPPRQPRRAEDVAQCVGQGLDAHLRSCTTNSGVEDHGGAIAFGCVFVVDAAQSPDIVPWHVIPAHASLFSAVLVRQSGPRPSRPCEDEACERWRVSCVAHLYEYIPWQSDEDQRPVPSDIGRVGLLGATLTGSARVAQILCNTLWSTPLQQPVGSRVRPGPRSTGEAHQSTSRLLIVAGGSAAYLRLVEDSFGMSRAGAGGQDVRFFTHVAAGAGHEADSDAGAVCDMHRGPCTPTGSPVVVTLANRYYTATVTPTLVHAALFDRAMLDVARQQLARAVGAHAAAQAAEETSDGGGMPALVFWPPDVGAEESWSGHCAHAARTTSFVYPPLATVLETLRATPGVGDIAVITGVRCAATLARAHSDTVRPTPLGVRSHEISQKDAPSPPPPLQQQQQQTMTRDHYRELRRMDPADRLDRFERHLCEEKGVEVITLDSLGDTDSGGEWGADDVSKAGTAAVEWDDKEEAEGPTGADRLRELLHCQQWPTARARVAARDAAPAQYDGNDCLIAVLGPGAEAEEEWLRQLLPRCLPFSSTHGVTCAPRSRSVLLDGCRTIPSVVLGAAGGVEVEVENKYFTAKLRLRVRGGVEGRLGGDGSLDGAGLITPTPSRPSLAPVTVFVCSCASLRMCADALDNTGQVRAWKASHTRAFADLLRGAQARLAAAWERGLADLSGEGRGEADGAGHEGDPAPPDWLADGTTGEFSSLLFLVDLSAEDEAAADAVATDLHRLLAPRHSPRVGSEVEDTHGMQHEDRADELFTFPLIEVVPGLPAGAAGPHADGELSGYVRLVEALAQHPWPRREGRRPAAGARPPAAAGATHDEHVSGDDPAREGSAAGAPVAETASADATVMGCDLPSHYLVDPLTLRSEAVPAMLYFQRRVVPAAGGSRPDDALEQRMQDDLLAWMDKMKVHGHRLTHGQRQQQAAILAELLERILE